MSETKKTFNSKEHDFPGGCPATELVYTSEQFMILNKYGIINAARLEKHMENDPELKEIKEFSDEDRNVVLSSLAAAKSKFKTE